MARQLPSPSPQEWREILLPLRQQSAVLESGALALPPDSVATLASRVDSMISLACEHLEGAVPKAAETSNTRNSVLPSSTEETSMADFGTVADAVVLRRLIGVICGESATLDEVNSAFVNEEDEEEEAEWRTSMAASAIQRRYRRHRLRARRVASCNDSGELPDVKNPEKVQLSAPQVAEGVHGEDGVTLVLPFLTDGTSLQHTPNTSKTPSPAVVEIVKDIDELLEWLEKLFQDPVLLASKSLSFADWALIRDSLGAFISNFPHPQTATGSMRRVPTTEISDRPSSPVARYLVDKSTVYLRFVGELMDALVHASDSASTSPQNAVNDSEDIDTFRNQHEDSIHHQSTLPQVGTTVQIFVRTTAGTVVTLLVSLDYSILQVKNLIRRAESIPNEQMIKLVFAGRELATDAQQEQLSLRDHGVGADSVLHLVIATEAVLPTERINADRPHTGEPSMPEMKEPNSEDPAALRTLLTNTATLLQQWKPTVEWEAARTGLIVELHAASAAAKSAGHLSSSLETAVDHAITILEKSTSASPKLERKGSNKHQEGTARAELAQAGITPVAGTRTSKQRVMASEVRDDNSMSPKLLPDAAARRFQRFLRRRPWRKKAWRRQQKGNQRRSQHLQSSSGPTRPKAVSPRSRRNRRRIEEARGSMESVQFRDKIFGGIVKWINKGGPAASAVVIQSWFRKVREQRRFWLLERSVTALQSLVRHRIRGVNLLFGHMSHFTDCARLCHY